MMKTMFASEAAPAEPPTPPPPTATPPPATPPPPPPAEPPPPPVVDPLAIARETGAAIGREIARERGAAPQPAPSAQTPSFELSPDDQEFYEIALWLANHDPAKHGNLPAVLLEYLKKSYAYIEEWSAKNPDHEWDENAEEHNAFFTANPPPMDAKMVEEAKIEMRIERGVEAKMKPIQEKITMMDDAQALEASSGRIYATANGAMMLLVEEAAPELAALLVNAQGVRELNVETAAKLKAAKPMAYKILNNYATQVSVLAQELERCFILKRPLSANVERFRQDREAILAAAPPHLQVFDDGKRFMSAADIKRTRADENIYRSFTARELAEQYATILADSARQELTEMRSLAEAEFAQNGGSGGGSGARPAQPAPFQRTNQVHIPTNRPPPPSISGASEATNPPKPPGEGVKTPDQTMADHMWRK